MKNANLVNANDKISIRKAVTIVKMFQGWAIEQKFARSAHDLDLDQKKNFTHDLDLKVDLKSFLYN